MNAYELMLLLHVLGAIVWIGGAVLVQILAIRVIGRDDAVELSRFAGEVEQVGLKVFIPASLLVIIKSFVASRACCSYRGSSSSG